MDADVRVVPLRLRQRRDAVDERHRRREVGEAAPPAQGAAVRAQLPARHQRQHGRRLLLRQRRGAPGALDAAAAQQLAQLHRPPIIAAPRKKKGARSANGPPRYLLAATCYFPPASGTETDYACSTPGGGRQLSTEGRYQFQRPSSFIDAGTRTERMIVASMSTAAPRPKPVCCSITRSPIANPPNTATMISAAPVISRPVDRNPKATASVLSPVWS